MTDTPRFTLRDLPLPAKLVVTVFLLSVGVGYFSALVQIHFQHSDKNGEAMPTPANVVAVFAGKKKANGVGEPPKSRLEVLISGPRTGTAGANMTPAFFGLFDDDSYRQEIKDRPKNVVDDERESERLAVVAWSKLDPTARKAAYDADRAEVPAALAGKPVPKDHKVDDKTVKIKSILKDRCEVCHAAGKEKSDIPLDTYEALERLMTVPAAPAGGEWVDSGKQMSLVKLTQSTHAHLLSFAVLFSLTGLVFAFTSYPTIVRCVLGPLVLLAQVADVSCWWLARLEPPYGPYFAYAILGTGGVVGLGLAAQIVLSVFNMYGPKGKVGVLLVFLLGGAVGGVVMTRVVQPYLDREKQNKPVPAPAEGGAVKPPPVVAVAATGVWGKTLLTGEFKAGGVWNGKVEGGMVRAFFDREEEYKAAHKMKAPELATLTAERETEQALVAEWFALPDAARKTAYDADSWAMPAALAKKPLTDKFKTGSAVKMKSLIADRCVVCHAADGEKNDAPLETYEQFQKYFGPPPPAKAARPADDKIPPAGD